MKTKIEKIVKIQEEFPFIYLGGSLALILQKAIPFRETKDIDLISKEYIHLHEIFNTEPKKLIKSISIWDERFELFINRKAEFIPLKYEDLIVNISPVYEIIEWKKKRGTKKHLEDIKWIN